MDFEADVTELGWGATVPGPKMPKPTVSTPNSPTPLADTIADTVRVSPNHPLAPPAVSDLVLPEGTPAGAATVADPPRRSRTPSMRGIGLGPTPAELDRLASLAGRRPPSQTAAAQRRESIPPPPNAPMPIAPPSPSDASMDPLAATPEELAGILDELDRSDPGIRAESSMAFSSRPAPAVASPAPGSLGFEESKAPEPVMAAAAKRNKGPGRGGKSSRRPNKNTSSRPAKVAPKSAPPSNDRRPTANEIRFDTAPMWRRLIATIIDAGLVAALVILPMRAGWFGTTAQNIRPWEPDDIGRALFEGHLTLPIVLTLLAVLVLGSIPHGLAGRTLGKLLTGLMIVNSWTGERPGWAQVLLRQIMGLVTTVLGAASYLWFIVDRRNAALHDRLSGTACVIANSRVVRAARDPVG